MDVLGVGADIVECVRIGRMIERHGEYFLQRVFTSREIAYCQSHKSAIERFAGRWAAKEAILKALGTGWQKGISWLDMEVRNVPSGAPIVALGGVAREHAGRRRIRNIHLSISHCRTHAIGYAMAVGDLPVESIEPIPDLPASETEPMPEPPTGE